MTGPVTPYPCPTCLSRDLVFRLLSPNETCVRCGESCPEPVLTVGEIRELVREKNRGSRP